MAYFGTVGIRDGANLDAFSRLRSSNPVYVFDAQFTYDLRTLLFEQITNGSGASIAHDGTNRCATMTFSSTPTGGKSYMQAYEWSPYQPGRSQLAFITFNMNGGVADVKKFAGLGDTTNGIFLELNGTTLQTTIYSGTATADTVASAAWNLDVMDGNGPSGITIDMSKTQILVVDYQALYVGRVRLGFDINGVVYYFHEYRHSNLITVPYIQIASLPVSCGMTCTGTVSTTMSFICASVMSEGGDIDESGIPYAAEGSGTAGSDAHAHILSVRPKATLNSIVNRCHFHLHSVDVLVTGNTNPVRFDLVVGQAISGTTTFNSVNANSCFEYNTAGTISGSPAHVLSSWYCEASKQTQTRVFTQKLPITLDAAGAVRANGTLSVLAYGIGGTSACRAAMNWSEVR